MIRAFVARAQSTDAIGTRAAVERLVPRLVAGFAAAALCASLAVAQNASGAAQSQGQSSAASASDSGQRTDGQIEMDVVKALDASQPLANDLITAATVHGEVTLAGTVSDQASKDLAGSIAGRVPGVTKVQNNLTIGNPQAAAEAEGLPDAENTAPAPDQSQAQAQGESGSEAAQEPGQALPDEQAGPGPDGTASAPPGVPQPGPNQYPGPNPPPRPEYSPYPPPPQSGQPPYGSQPPYGQQPPSGQPYGYGAPPRYRPSYAPVLVPQGTLLQVRTAQPVSSKHAAAGTPVEFTLIRDVVVNGALAIPRGATLHGVVSEAKNVGSGKLAGHSELALTLTSLDLGGRNYPIESDQFKVRSPNKAGETVNHAIAGGILGAIFGCAVGRGAGCAIGAGAGAAAGTAASAASGGPHAWIPPEALVDFRLTAPVTVTPVSPEEAARLAQGLYPGGPRLYRRRGPYGYYPPPYGYPAYAYPPVYYRPYYMVGGVYYWR